MVRYKVAGCAPSREWTPGLPGEQWIGLKPRNYIIIIIIIIIYLFQVDWKIEYNLVYL